MDSSPVSFAGTVVVAVPVPVIIASLARAITTPGQGRVSGVDDKLNANGNCLVLTLKLVPTVHYALKVCMFRFAVVKCHIRTYGLRALSHD